MQQTIEPVDALVKAGFAQQMIRQFRAEASYTTAPDKLKALQQYLGNKTPTYPYIFLNVQSTAPNNDSYNAHRLSRHGIPVSLNTDNNQIQTARIVPVNFEIEVTFITNKYTGELDAVQGFVTRWLFARRNGALQFNVDYGLSQLSISYMLSDNVPTPPRENPADGESVYQVVTTATVHGFISEPELGTRGRVNRIQLAEVSVEQLQSLGIQRQDAKTFFF
jgi:hypothetical protein